MKNYFFIIIFSLSILFSPLAANAFVCTAPLPDRVACKFPPKEDGGEYTDNNKESECQNWCISLELDPSLCRVEDECPIVLENPLRAPSISSATGEQDIATILGRVVGAALGVIGAITLLVFVYGGYLWLISGGNEEKIHKGSQTMLYAVIGLCIIFASYGILNTILTGLGV